MSAKMEPGTYQCKTTAATIEEFPSGAVMCRIGLDIGLTGGICLIQKDGTLSDRGFRDVQAIMGLDGAWDWGLWGQEPEAWAGHDIEAVVETQQGERGEFSSVKFLNPLGGSVGRMKAADVKSLSAKYGAKTRALFGGVPAATISGMKPASQLKSCPPPPTPKKTELSLKGGSSTMEECWEKWTEKNGEDPEKWWAAVKQVTAKEQNDCTPDDWSKMMSALTDDLPF